MDNNNNIMKKKLKINFIAEFEAVKKFWVT